jgi:cobalamin biosynthesis Mg chelatase CobN
MTFTPNKAAGNMTFKISSNLNVTVSVSDRAGNTVSKTFSVEYVPIPSSTTSSSTGTGTPATGTESYTETFTETYSPPESSAVEIVPYIGLAIIVAAAVLAAIIALKRRREKVLVQPEAQPPSDLGQVVSA